MTKGRLLLWAVTSALAGFLFGFDTVVISGAEKEIQDIWALSGTMHGWALSSALWGTVLGACFGGIPTKKWGRKKILIFNGILYVVSAVGSGIAWDVSSFIIARFIGGVGIGISTIAAPLFIAEISPARDRGKLGGLFQFNIVFGILVAYLSNYIIGNVCDIGVGWRWMLGVEALPAIIYTLMCFSLPESPRWLIVDANRPEEGAEVFRKINPGMNESEIRELVASVEATRVPEKQHSKFWSMRLRKPIFFAFLIAFFNQVSGINVILYFAPRLLGLAGMDNALAASISLGITNLIFTFVGLWLIDRLGRRTLLYIGSAGYILSLGVCAIAFFSFPEFKVVSASLDTITGAEQVIRMERGEGYYAESDKLRARNDYSAARKALAEATSSEQYEGSRVILPEQLSPAETRAAAEIAKLEASKLLGASSLIVLACMIVFIAAHAVGSGTIIWVFISEIFPNDQRATGQALGSFTHWIFAALLTLAFPIAIKAFDAGYMFAFFCVMMILQLIWAKTMMPETKGLSLEQIEHDLDPV
ncbi:MAG: sugar porter family MFS transporter [Lentisphaeria bacterium]|nr:sugar porter family MFS transporter [Lentisphaeria bacterium]